MLNRFADFEKLVRNVVFENAGPDMRFCFGVAAPEDASLNAAGDLFRQNEDFLIFETDIDGVTRAGPGYTSPRRARGSLTIGLATKSTHNEIACLDRLEQVAEWFGDKTIGGVRFRQFLPTGSSPLMGFQTHDGFINCDFELKPAPR